MVKCQKCGKEVATVSSLGNCVLCMSPNAKFYSPDGKELIQAEIKKKEVNNMTENVEKLQEELEEQKEKTELYEGQLRAIAQKKIEEKIAELKIPESEADYFRENPEALKGYSLGKSSAKESGKGSLGMTQEMIEREQGTHENDKKEFNSIEEMLEWTRKNDKEAYEAIKAKTYRGLTENKNFFEWKDTFDENGNSIIKRTLERANKDARRKAGYKGENE